MAPAKPNICGARVWVMIVYFYGNISYSHEGALQVNYDSTFLVDISTWIQYGNL